MANDIRTTLEAIIAKLSEHDLHYSEQEAAAKTICAALSAPAASEPVTDAEIDKVFDNWCSRNDSGIKYLRTYVEGFRHIARDILAERASPSSAPASGAVEPGWVARKAAFDAMDDGQGPYMAGRVLSTTGWTYAPLWAEFKEWAKDHLGQGFSLACDEGSLIDPITAATYHGFYTGRETATPPPSGKPGSGAVAVAEVRKSPFINAMYLVPLLPIEDFRRFEGAKLYTSPPAAEAQPAALVTARERELIAALEPFIVRNSSNETVTITVKTADVTRARAALVKARIEQLNAAQPAAQPVAEPVARVHVEGKARGIKPASVDAAGFDRFKALQHDAPLYSAAQPVAQAAGGGEGSGPLLDVIRETERHYLETENDRTQDGRQRRVAFAIGVHLERASDLARTSGEKA